MNDSDWSWTQHERSPASHSASHWFLRFGVEFVHHLSSALLQLLLLTSPRPHPLMGLDAKSMFIPAFQLSPLVYFSHGVSPAGSALPTWVVVTERRSQGNTGVAPASFTITFTPSSPPVSLPLLLLLSLSLSLYLPFSVSHINLCQSAIVSILFVFFVVLFSCPLCVFGDGLS